MAGLFADKAVKTSNGPGVRLAAELFPVRGLEVCRRSGADLPGKSLAVPQERSRQVATPFLQVRQSEVSQSVTHSRPYSRINFLSPSSQHTMPKRRTERNWSLGVPAQETHREHTLCPAEWHG